jgi:hypothetical protein
MTQEQKRVWLRFQRLRPEKCWVGVAVRVISLPKRDLGLLVPVELADLFWFYAPAAEVVADAAGGDDPVGFAGELLHGALVEVVVVVVGEEDGLERGQLANGDGRLVEALGAGEEDGRGAVGEDGVGEEEGALELEENGGVAEAPEGAVGAASRAARVRGRRELCPGGAWFAAFRA